MVIIQNILAAILPPLYIIYYIYNNDLYEKEPRKLLVKAFVIGCLTVIPAIFLELTFDQNFFKNTFLFALIGVGFVEEGVKFIFLRWYCFKQKDFNEPYDGIVYAVVISMGFAMVENISYVLQYDGNGLSLAIGRMFSAIPLHATCGVIMGYYFGIAKMNKEKIKQSYLLAIILPTIIHGIYDYFLFIGFGIMFSLLVLCFAIIYSKKAIKIHQEGSPFKT